MTVYQNFTGISPETPTKIRILSAALHIPKNKLLDLMVDRLWEEKKDMVTETVSQNVANKQARKILESLKP